MPADARGTELNVGDEVIVRCRIDAVREHKFFNLHLVTVVGQNPANLRLHSSQVELCPTWLLLPEARP